MTLLIVKVSARETLQEAEGAIRHCPNEESVARAEAILRICYHTCGSARRRLEARYAA